jgi:hypothetical protein
MDEDQDLNSQIPRLLKRLDPRTLVLDQEAEAFPEDPVGI